MVLFGIAVSATLLMYLLLLASDDRQEQAREDTEQMEYLRRYYERKK